MRVATNRLASETSPYLRQHAHNPVDWYPWGDEALERARRENKPILLSIGYSACHWCHVMERESFEDEAIAAQMNRSFVNIKVDREERPDLDAIYMNAVQMLTGSGGWPLTVFLTPDGKPFYGGTYFPPTDRYGRPGFPRVLEGIAQAYRDSPSEVARATQQLMEGFARISTFTANAGALRPETVARAADALLQHCDPVNGGIGGAPKFPNVPVFSLFLRRYHSTGRRELLEAVSLVLSKMAQGGIYDQLGGGFHRYSVDATWLVPHFEKMLYDNAQLAVLYLDGFAAAGDPAFRRVASETLDYMAREMRHAQGGFYSTEDADSEGEEGKFYLWKKDELESLLDPADAELACRYFDVDELGNFAEPGGSERRSILTAKLSTEQTAVLFRLPPDEVAGKLARVRATLLAARERRIKPDRDEKILTSWNALAIRAFVKGAMMLEVPRYLEVARAAADFIEANLSAPQGHLLRTWHDGIAKYPAYLDDYAFLAAALLDLFEATGEAAYLARASECCDLLVAEFADREAGGFFFTGSAHERLVDRPKIAFDGSIPSGNAVAAETMMRLGHLTGDEAYTELARATLGLFGEVLERQPFGAAYLLGVLDDSLNGPLEVVVVGARDDAATRALVRVAQQTYAPGKSVLVTAPGEPAAHLPNAARGKAQLAGRPTAYVCRSFTCSEPVTDPAALRALLAR